MNDRLKQRKPMNMKFNQIPQWLIGLFGSASIIGMVTLVLKLFASGLQIQLIALLYLLPVLVCTLFWGLTSGILAGLLSFLAFNFYFIPPYLTLAVHQSQDVITLIVFLIVAVVVSQLIGQARQAERLARKREWEATRMYELISALAGLTDTQSIIQTLAQKIIDTFGFDQVEIIANEQVNEKPVSYRLSKLIAQEEPCELALSMFTTRTTEGEIRLWFDQNTLSLEETRLLAAFSSQGAMAIERVHLMQRENIARILEESDRVKTSLLNSVSHELRTPLAAIKASASSLRSGAVDWDTDARRELIATIDEETDSLNLLVGNLLDMSRIEAGALKPMKRWNSIQEIVKGVEVKMQTQLAQHPIEYQIPEAYPLVPTDYVLIGQVFTNLFSNSVKYAPPDSPIVVFAGVSDGNALIKVINQSPPVPEEHLEHIFDKFHRVTQADKITGTGLGLSICKGIIEAHGGKIWAENQPEGFSFNISLPLTLDGELPKIPKDAIDG